MLSSALQKLKLTEPFELVADPTFCTLFGLVRTGANELHRKAAAISFQTAIALTPSGA